MALPTYGLGEQTALWHGRWPLIALQECVDQVEAAPKEMKEGVRWNLPCEGCPENTACLTGKLKEVGGLMFDREYQTKPRSSQSSLFPFERMEVCLNRELHLVETYRKPIGVEERYGVASGWDIAWSERAGGDYLAKLTARIDRETGKKRLLDIDRWQRLSFEAQIELIQMHNGRYRDDLVVVEEDFAQVVWKQYLSGRTNVPVIGHSAGGKRNFEFGVPVLLRDIDAQKWEFPYAPDGRNIDMVKAFLGEAEAFGWSDDKLEGVGEHDDLVMAWWHLDWGLEKLRSPGGWRRRVSSTDRRGAEL